MTTESLMEWDVKAYKNNIAMSPVMMNWSSGGGGSFKKRSLNSFMLLLSLLLLPEGTSDRKTVAPSVSSAAFQEFRIDQSWSSGSSRCREASIVFRFRFDWKLGDVFVFEGV